MPLPMAHWRNSFGSLFPFLRFIPLLFSCTNNYNISFLYFFCVHLFSWPQKQEKVSNWNQSSWVPIDYFTHWRTKGKWRKKAMCTKHVEELSTAHADINCNVRMEFDYFEWSHHREWASEQSKRMKRDTWKTNMETENFGCSSHSGEWEEKEERKKPLAN